MKFLILSRNRQKLKKLVLTRVSDMQAGYIKMNLLPQFLRHNKHH